MAATAKIDTRAWDAFKKRVAAIGGKRIGVGVFGDEALSIIAASQEYGADIMRAGEKVGEIPERSYLRSTFRDDKQELSSALERAGRAVYSGRLDGMRAIGLLGSWAVNSVKAKIRSNIPPPLQQSTIDRKGSSKSLIDTGRLLNSITSKLVDGTIDARGALT